MRCGALFQIDPTVYQAARGGDEDSRPTPQAAARGERGRAGLHQRRRRKDRRGVAAAAPTCRLSQPRLCERDGADLGPHRPLARHRRCAGRPGRGDAARADPADQPDVRQLHADDDRRARAPARRRERQVPARRRPRRGERHDRARGRQRLRRAGQAPVLRPQRRPQLGTDHLARRGAEPARHPPARHVRARAPRAGGDADRHRRSAAGGATRLDRRLGDGRQQRRQGRAAAGQGRRRARRGLAHPRRPEARRDGDGRRLPEAAPERVGEARALARGCFGRAGRVGRIDPLGRPWRSSSSTVPSSRG